MRVELFKRNETHWRLEQETRRGSDRWNGARAPAFDERVSTKMDCTFQALSKTICGRGGQQFQSYGHLFLCSLNLSGAELCAKSELG